jgi:hypothetical protein
MRHKQMVAAVAALMLLAFAGGMEFANVRNEAAQQKFFSELRVRGCASNATRLLTRGW